MQTFTLKEEHIKLLRAAYVTWNQCEFGAPAIDCKRPYGNSSVHQDIAEILGIPMPNFEEGEDFSEEQMALMDNLHKESKIALQIILATGQFKPGSYAADSYSTNWRESDSSAAFMRRK